MSAILPTFTANGATVADFRRAWIDAMATGNHNRLSLYFYAASVGGWEDVRVQIAAWEAATGGQVHAFIGTDHGVTDPDALRNIKKAGVTLRLLTRYEGFYHPKLVGLSGAAGGTILAGSNNLSASGLLKNFEFALSLTYQGATPADLQIWIDAVEAASEEATDALIADYEKQRKKFEAATGALSKKFVWKRRSTSAVAAPPPPSSGSLVMEIGERETGPGGKQIQPPLPTLPSFWSFPHGAEKDIKARLKGQPGFRDAKLMRVAHSMARLQIPELDYGHRPGFFIFTKVPGGYEYEIVTKAQEPARYAQLEKLAPTGTTPRSRRWKILP